MKTLFTLTCLIMVTALTAAPLQRVAYDDAGNSGDQPHLIDGENYTFKGAGGATPAQLSVVFGNTVTFAYNGLRQGATYQAKLTFFADGNRTMKVRAGSAVLGEITVKKNQVVSKTFDIPASAIGRDEMMLVIERISGPNAVVSEVEILSDAPGALGAMASEKSEALFGNFDMAKIQLLRPTPTSVDGVKSPLLDLGGTWKFNPAPDLAKIADAGSQSSQWSDIKVPGQWANQGFDVKPGTAAAYARNFTVPADWSGKRVILRCDAVYSDAVIYLNGTRVGTHSGGFTPFDVDLTKALKPRENSLVITALTETEADKLASASRYACYQLGGIPRGIRLMALPDTHLTSFRVITKFDSSYDNATLELDSTVAGGPAELQVSLQPIGAKKHVVSGVTVPTGAASIPVKSPAKWDPEHPNLYQLTVNVVAEGKTVQTVSQRIGFRQVEVRGNEMFVNNQPVKLRGVNLHQVYPTTGRHVPPGINRRDVEMFREGNVNLIRTSHYPPDAELIEAADELGMFIECEAPICWAPGSGQVDLVCLQSAEIVQAYRNHPSVLFWSLANESKWGPQFRTSSRVVRELDPSRPQVFNDLGSVSDRKFTELMNMHYPAYDGPAAARKGLPQPLYLGEESHLNAYNRLELATDPALRDIWGQYHRKFWDEIYQTKGALGLSIWSGVDDTFYLKDDQTVGYGTWGSLDGWRRKKPEWWGMKKGYSPIRIGDPTIDAEMIRITVENRYCFTDLAETKVTWKSGGKSGTVTPDKIAPGGNGSLTIPRGNGETLELTFHDPRGFVADEFHLCLVPRKPILPAAEKVAWDIDEKTGQITRLGAIPLSGPQLMLLPLNKEGETQMTGKTKIWKPFTAPNTGWVCAKVEKNAADNSVAVTGTYDGAKGSYQIKEDRGTLVIHYEFEVTEPVNPRQTGLVFSLPGDYETLTWEREGYWNVYPDDHIARIKGTVTASEGFEATSVGPRTEPKHPWRLDNLPYGNNDFCSTKHNIFAGSLTKQVGAGVAIDGGGTQHLRAWRDSTGVHFLVADYSNGGSERFLRGLARKDDRPLKLGDKVSGTVRLSVR